MSGPFVLEIAVESAGAAVAAARGGADRIELCADLRHRGLTPSRELMSEARAAFTLPIHSIIHPRVGDFVYSGDEFEQIKGSIALAHELKMDGVVLGILKADHSIDVPRSKELIQLSRPMKVTFHRAFDDCVSVDSREDKDVRLARVLEEVISTGADRLLTSGGAPNVLEGTEALQLLSRRAGKRIVIMPGGGIQPANFRQIRELLGAAEYHSGLGTVFSYGSADVAAFEQAVRKLKNGE
jgi:copper homeostasis protein